MTGPSWRVHVIEPTGESVIIAPTDGDDSQHLRHMPIHGALDEVVAGEWLHMELLSTEHLGGAAQMWVLDIAGMTVEVLVDDAGKPLRVHVVAPAEDGMVVPGCVYSGLLGDDDD